MNLQKSNTTDVFKTKSGPGLERYLLSQTYLCRPCRKVVCSAATQNSNFVAIDVNPWLTPLWELAGHRLSEANRFSICLETQCHPSPEVFRDRHDGLRHAAAHRRRANEACHRQ